MPLVRKSKAPTQPGIEEASGTLDRLTTGTDEERWRAARAASEMPASVRALGAALATENNARVREAIFTSLVTIATSESVEQILPILRSDIAPLRTGALDALRAMRTAVLPYLSQLIEDADSDVRLLACELARNLPSEEASRLLSDLLGAEPEVNVCASAVEVLAEVGDETSLNALSRCAGRFRESPFLDFAIKVTVARIRAQPSRRRD